nr:hypothetical protein [Chitinophagaceae bacterium]
MKKVLPQANHKRLSNEFSQALAKGSVYSLLIAAGAGVITTGVCPCTLPVGLGIAGLVSSNTENKSN